jgi:NADPH-dependent F420 reductase
MAQRATARCAAVHFDYDADIVNMLTDLPKSPPLPQLAILGGTGALGGALARAFALRGYAVTVASRDPAKAAAAAAALAQRVPGAALDGDGLANAAARAQIAILAVPYAAHRETLETVRAELAGKILIDATVPLRPPKVGTVQLPALGCAALEAQEVLGPAVRVVSAFQNIAAHKLLDDLASDCDVLVAGDDPAAREVVIALIEAIGLKGWHAGPLANSAAAEALTSVLIQINRRYGVKGSGLRIVLGG